MCCYLNVHFQGQRVNSLVLDGDTSAVQYSASVGIVEVEPIPMLRNCICRYGLRPALVLRPIFVPTKVAINQEDVYEM